MPADVALNGSAEGVKPDGGMVMEPRKALRFHHQLSFIIVHKAHISFCFKKKIIINPNVRQADASRFLVSR